MAGLLESSTYILLHSKNRFSINRKTEEKYPVQCAAFRSWRKRNNSWSKEVIVNREKENRIGKLRILKERNQTYLTEEEDDDGVYGWKVRRLREDDMEEMKRVALIQAEAFHITMPLFNDLFFQFFQAEVLSGLLYKLGNSPPDRYACLVAEPTNSEPNQNIVGIVDVTALRDSSVLQHLHGTQEYLYVSGLAVSKSFRRKKMGTALLNACDVLCEEWGFKCLTLRVYEDDFGARKLYTNAGYRVVSADPLWSSLYFAANYDSSSCKLLILQLDRAI